MSYMEEDMPEPLPTYIHVALAKMQQHRLQLPKSPSRRARNFIAIGFAIVCIGTFVTPLALIHGHLDLNGDD